MDQATDEMERRFATMHHDARHGLAPDRNARNAMLTGLRETIGANRNAIAAAINADFGNRPYQETLMAEILPSLAAIDDALSHLKSWMKPKGAPVALHFFGAKNMIQPQPKGVVLIIAPWNYPLLLSVGPLVAAIAAGNRIVLKPSEITPATSALLKRLLEDALTTEFVSVETGDANVAKKLTSLPFDHILFTGATSIGRHVMRAAAENLTPVTLELGGKSPAIVHEDFDLDLAARRIARGKLMNAGQTCIAPDYVLAPRAKLEEFIAAYGNVVTAMYPTVVDNPEYSSIVSEHHFTRLQSLVDDAKEKGAQVQTFENHGELPDDSVASSNNRKILPLVITGVNDDMIIMREEIFGPPLPIVAYDELDEIIHYINNRPRPLALYYFDNDTARVRYLLESTVSGGVSVNDTILHVAQEELPFGGIGPSGMGAYHGRYGFETFSHHKPVFHQAKVSTADLLVPPYGDLFAKTMKAMLWRFKVR